jgi:hypothetical protein
MTSVLVDDDDDDDDDGGKVIMASCAHARMSIISKGGNMGGEPQEGGKEKTGDSQWSVRFCGIVGARRRRTKITIPMNMDHLYNHHNVSPYLHHEPLYLHRY